jgi:DNA-binding NarL/FixJ family response regulator
MIKLAIVDDEVLLREALSDVIELNPRFKVTIKAKSGRQIIQMLESANDFPDVILMDINMPDIDGLTASRILIEKFPEVRILIFTMYDTDLLLVKLLSEGVRGFLKKDIVPSELEAAIESVYNNGTYINQYATVRLLEALKKKGGSDAELCRKGSPNLNDIELRFLRLACGELTYKEIATILCISPRTVDNYRDALFDKLDVKSRVGLAMYAVRNGLCHFEGGLV